MLTNLIRDNWGFVVNSITDAPRQFVAKTYFVNTDHGKFFCKVIDKKLFIPAVIKSLPTLKEIHYLGLDRINFPIPTVTNELFAIHDGSLVVLFNYIDAPQSYEYDNAELGKLLAEIHKLSQKVKAETQNETFMFKHADIFEERLASLAQLESIGVAEQSASKLLQRSYDNLITLYKIFQNLALTCQKNCWQMVLTHGDVPGNILVKSPDDFYIVDWDDILLAPAERDLWFLIDKDDFLEGYKIGRNDFVVNEVAAQYYLLSRYFNDLVEYWAEIFGESGEAHKESNFNEMKRELFEEDGWLYPQVKKFI